MDALTKVETKPRANPLLRDKPFDPWEEKFRSHFAPSSVERANTGQAKSDNDGRD